MSKDFELENKLYQLRKKWSVTKDPVMRKVIKKQAKLLKTAKEKAEDIIEVAGRIMK